MLLYVMRHGPAEDRAPSGRDFDRALTPSGRELVRRMAAAFGEAHAGGPPRILASPRVRARETAEILHAALLGPASPVAGLAPPPPQSPDVTPPAGTPLPWLSRSSRPSAFSTEGISGAIEIRHELDGEKAIPLELIAELAENGRDALLVGHQPCVDELVRQLVESGHDGGFPSSRPGIPGDPGYRRTPTPPAIAGFRTAMIVGLEGARPIAPNPRRWRLALVLDPRRIAP